MGLQKQTVTPTIVAAAGNVAQEQEVDTRFASSVGFGIDLDHSAATAINVTLYKSADGTNYERVPSLDVDAGTGTASPYTFTLPDVDADATTWVDLDCENAVKVKISVSLTAGTADDKITIRPCTSSWS